MTENDLIHEVYINLYKFTGKYADYAIYDFIMNIKHDIIVSNIELAKKINFDNVVKLFTSL